MHQIHGLPPVGVCIEVYDACVHKLRVCVCYPEGCGHHRQKLEQAAAAVTPDGSVMTSVLGGRMRTSQQGASPLPPQLCGRHAVHTQPTDIQVCTSWEL